MQLVRINGFTAEIKSSEDSNWQEDTIIIHNAVGCISDEDIAKIIEYLYAESFIQDRRTKYFIVEAGLL